MTELTHTELCGTGNLSLPLERHQKPRLHHVLKSSGQHILASQQPPAPRLSYLHPTPTVSGKLSASSVSRPENLPPFVVPSKRVTTTGRVKCLKHMLVVTVLYLKHSSPFPSIYSIKSKLLSSALQLPRSDLPPPPPSPNPFLRAEETSRGKVGFILTHTAEEGQRQATDPVFLPL